MMEGMDAPATETDFPSGPWAGFYQFDGRCFPQQLELTFEGGVIRGGGWDNVGEFTIKGSYDLECVCNGRELCPVGIASSCDEVTGLFAHRTLTEICNQVGDGACAEVGRSTEPSAPRTSATCDKVCAADCAGSPHCLQSCGC